MNQDLKPKTQNGYENKNNYNNTGGDPKVKKHSLGQISTNRKNWAVKLKGIPEDIIAEGKKADICLKY